MRLLDLCARIPARGKSIGNREAGGGEGGGVERDGGAPIEKTRINTNQGKGSWHGQHWCGGGFLALLSGPKARHVTAWAELSLTSAGPGERFRKFPEACRAGMVPRRYPLSGASPSRVLDSSRCLPGVALPNPRLTSSANSGQAHWENHGQNWQSQPFESSQPINARSGLANSSRTAVPSPTTSPL
jgi:hypothetical protein